MVHWRRRRRPSACCGIGGIVAAFLLLAAAFCEGTKKFGGNHRRRASRNELSGGVKNEEASRKQQHTLGHSNSRSNDASMPHDQSSQSPISRPASDTEVNASATSKSIEPVGQVLPHSDGGPILSAVIGKLSQLQQLFPLRKIARLGLTGCQIGLLYVLIKTTWQAVSEALEEISDEMDSLGGGGSVKEEHDKKWLDAQGVEEAIYHTGLDFMKESQEGHQEANGDANDSASCISGNASVRPNISTSTSKGRRKKYLASYETASDLARRLRAAGLPMVEPPDLPPEVAAKMPNSVQHVLKSLTRTEGRLLEATLLSPIDSDENEGILSTRSGDRHNKISGIWADIGGLDDVKDGLLDLAFPLHMNQQGADESYYGGLLSNPAGVLLYGPPGCGKTTLVRALASTANSRVLCVTPSNLMRKYVGETELQVRALFTLARKIAPCVIFIDEVDGLFRERGSTGGAGGGGEHDVSRDLKTEFMQLIDGIRSKKAGGCSANEQILLIGATNRPFDVDSGFLRRMPRSFFVGLPNRMARIAVLKSMLKQVPLSSDFDVEAIADATELYSPSDLRELLRSAALIPLREARFNAVQQAEEQSRRQGPPATPTVRGLRPLRTGDVLGALAKVAPTQLNPSYVTALTEYATRAGALRSANPEASTGSTYDSMARQSRQSYQHLNGYYVHKASNGSFLADIGTFSIDGHHPQTSGLGEDISGSDHEDEYDTYDELNEETSSEGGA